MRRTEGVTTATRAIWGGRPPRKQRSRRARKDDRDASQPTGQEGQEALQGTGQPTQAHGAGRRGTVGHAGRTGSPRGQGRLRWRLWSRVFSPMEGKVQGHHGQLTQDPVRVSAPDGSRTRSTLANTACTACVDSGQTHLQDAAGGLGSGSGPCRVGKSERGPWAQVGVRGPKGWAGPLQPPSPGPRRTAGTLC